jgi:hypothetical protein
MMNRRDSRSNLRESFLLSVNDYFQGRKNQEKPMLPALPAPQCEAAHIKWTRLGRDGNPRQPEKLVLGYVGQRTNFWYVFRLFSGLDCLAGRHMSIAAVMPRRDRRSGASPPLIIESTFLE